MSCCNYRPSTLFLVSILITGTMQLLSAQDDAFAAPPNAASNQDQTPARLDVNEEISVNERDPLTAESTPAATSATTTAQNAAQDTQPSAARVIIIEITPDIERSEVIRQVVEALEKNGQAKRGEVNPAGKPIGYSATMFVRRDTPYQKAKQLVEALKSLSMNQLKFSAVGNGEFEQNSVVVQCPADVSWRRVRTITDTLEKLGDVHVDVRVFEPRVTTQGASPANGQDSVAPPKPAIPSPFERGRKTKSSSGDSPVPGDVKLPMASGSSTNDGVFSFSIGISRNPETDLRARQQSLDQKSRELATRLRGPLPDPATGDQLKRELQNAVREAFQARQELQRAELAEFARRLKGIQESIETRDRISQQIIDRRIEELLDPSLKWEETQATSGRAQALRSDSTEVPNTTSPDGSRRAAGETQSNSTMASVTDRVLVKTPDELHKLLARVADERKAVESAIRLCEKDRNAGNGDAQTEACIENLQKQLAEKEGQQAHTRQEYLEQINLLEAVLQRDRARLTLADETMRSAEDMQKKGYVSRAEVQTFDVQLQEARVALQKSESLLKLYQQAGEGLVSSSEESASAPSLVGDRVASGQSHVPEKTPETSRIYSRENRWEVRYPNDPKQFGRALDFFGVELGSADGDTKEITYLSSPAAGELAVRRDLCTRESRLFLTEADGESIHLAKTYLDQAGIETRGRLVMWFYSDETAQLLAHLEAEHAAGKSIELVKKTVFGMRPKEDGFEFYVISQSEKPTIQNDAAVEAASERGAATNAPINPKLAEICSQAHATLMSIETLQYRFEKKDDQGWKSHAEFYADHIRFRVNRKDVTGIMSVDEDLKPIRNPPMTISSAFDGQKQQYARQNEPLRVKHGREGGSYGITIPQIWAYGWLRDGAAEFHWDTILSKELWEQRFQDAIYIGNVTEDGRRFEIVDFPQRLEQVTPCIYRVYFARDLGFLPLKIFRNTLAANEPSTTVRVTRFKTFTVKGKQIAIPLDIQHRETQADGVSHKGETTITVDESSLRVNYPLDDSLFTLNDVNEPSTAIE